LQGQVKWLRDNGGLLIPMYLTQVAALNPTDRTLCEVAVNAKRNSEYADIRSWLWDASFDDPASVAVRVEQGNSYSEQYLATLALSGSLQKDGVKSNPNYGFLNEVIAGMKLPSLVKYCVTRSLKLGMEGLPTALPVNWQAFTDAIVMQRILPPAPMIAGLPSIAYDKHVLEGKKAIGYFCKACEPVNEFLSTRDHLNRVDAVGSAIFEEEGGNVLRRSLVYNFQQEQLNAARTAHMFSSGLGAEEGEELCGIVRDNFDSLNAARKRVIG
jgi:hypothetical protein